MGELIGYARVSSRGQDLSIQTDALTGAGVHSDHLYAEKVSGTKRQGRDALDELLARGIRKGDTLVCTRLDRLSRSVKDLLRIAETLEDKGVNLRCLEQQIDTSRPEGRLFFTMLAAFGQFETEIRKERQREGITAALAKGDASPFRGRPATIDGAQIVSMKAQGMTPTAIAKKLGVARSSVYRLMNEG